MEDIQLELWRERISIVDVPIETLGQATGVEPRWQALQTAQKIIECRQCMASPLDSAPRGEVIGTEVSIRFALVRCSLETRKGDLYKVTLVVVHFGESCMVAWSASEVSLSLLVAVIQEYVLSIAYLHAHDVGAAVAIVRESYHDALPAYVVRIESADLLC
jgi:hypothetical protein